MFVYAVRSNKSAIIAKIAEIFKATSKPMPLSIQMPVASLVIVPAIAAMQKPKPISVALNERLLNTSGVR